MILRKLLVPLLILSTLAIFAQNNIISQDRWVVGTPTNQLTPEFEASGGSTRNYIESLANPFNESAPIWHCLLAPNEVNKYPGFKTEQFTTDDIDVNQDYRYSVWVKTTSNQYIISTLVADNTGYDFEIGANGPINERLSINGSNKNIPGLNQWYLLIGYVRAANSSESDDDYATLSGYYEVNGTTRVDPAGLGQIIGRFHPTKTNVNFKMAQQYYARDSSHEVFFYNPRFEPIDGQEPSIADLTNPNWVEPEGRPGEGGLWSSNTSGIHYSSGNVGIGVDLPTEKLEVNGQIHAREVKVDVNFPAPDYVFYEDYDLKTLEEIKQYIKNHGHLPNIPSAKEIEANGIELGLMNMKLLEKIEELTLYILQQNKQQKELENRISQLEHSNKN